MDKNKMGLLGKIIFSFSVSFNLISASLAIQLQLSRKEIVQTHPILESFGKNQILTLRLLCVGNVKRWAS